jgi:hypothetical protein
MASELSYQFGQNSFRRVVFGLIIAFMLIPIKHAMPVSSYSGSSAHETSHEGGQNRPTENDLFTRRMLPVSKLADDEDEHVAAVSYYNLTDGWDSTLMLSNQGPDSMTVDVVLFALNGERLNVPPLTLAGNSAKVFDIRDWATSALAFQQGSLQIHYEGHDRELAGFTKIAQQHQGLIFDEQLTAPEEYFLSSQLEGVWWLPSEKAEMSIVVSNTSNREVTATVTLTCSNEKKDKSLTILLGAHQTQLLNAKELIGAKRETLTETGGISVKHNGAAGSVFAEALVQDAASGFSSILNLQDPHVAVSNRLDGGGLRIGKVGDEPLTQVAVARNIGDIPTIVSGRIVFSAIDGRTGSIAIPEERLSPGEAKTLELARAIKKSRVTDFASAGLEFEYTGTPGSVVMTALSITESENQVFRVPLVDAKSLKINTGKYPWSIEKSASTVIYLKNVTDETQEYSMYLRFPGGEYVPPLQRVEAGQTVLIDPKKIRDQQMSDEYRNKIPLTVKDGYFSWSAHSTKNLVVGEMEKPENQVIIGRSESVDIKNGMSSTGTYGCNCQDSYEDSRIEHQLADGSWGWAQNSPVMEVWVGETIQLRGRQQDSDGCGNYSSWHAPYTWVGWGSTTVAADDPNGLAPLVVDENGLATGQAGGTANAGAAWETVRWLPLYECCEYQTDSAEPLETVIVKPKATIGPLVAVPKNGTTAVHVDVNKPNTSVDLVLSTTTGTGSALFNSNNSTTLTITQGTDVVIKGITESSTADNIRLTAKVGNSTQGKKDFSVVWVSISILTTFEDSIPTDNSARDAYASNMGSARLGTFFSIGFAAELWRNGVQITGTVMPSNFTGSIMLQREVVYYQKYDDETLIEQDGPFPDNSEAPMRDDNPQSGNSGGKVYDLDAPGTGNGPSQPLGRILRIRTNYRQWAVFGTMKVSDDFLWFSRLSVIKMSSGDQLYDDVSGDNKAGSGTTSLSWNLQ